jgi:hypothetical protein
MTDERVRRLLERLDAVERRLAAHAERDRPSGLTDPDQPSGERWEAGQVWSHTAEFVPYWMEQLRSLFERYPGEPLPFGRIKTDPDRISAIDRDRDTAIPELMERTRRAIGDLRAWLPTIEEPAWRAQGVIPNGRTVETAEIVDAFLVGHLEEHADQLDGLSARGPK